MEIPNEPLNNKGQFLYKHKKLSNDFPVPYKVVENERFIANMKSVKLVYFYMAYLANKYASEEGWFFHSYRKLAKLTDLDEKTVMAAVKRLVKDEFLECVDGGYSSLNVRKPTRYRVWGGENRPLKEPMIDSQGEPENGKDDELNYDNTYGL